MGVASAVQWWEDSQLRVLVLGSLVVQCILLVASTMRRKSVRFWWVRPVTWLAYLGSDAIAIYGLATLFNHYKKQEGGHGYSAVEVLWAPILLIHLGGQDSITAYNIEDNELWLRHILTAVSQITVAIYVFWKSWPRSDRRLLQAAILLFVPGILKCLEKPCALYSASINSLVSSDESVRRTTKKHGNTDRLDDFVTKAADCCAAEAGAKASDEDLDLQTEGGAKTRDEDLQLQPEAGAKASDEDLQLQPEAEAKARDEDLELQSEAGANASNVDLQVQPEARSKAIDDEEIHLEADKLFVDLASPSEKRLKALQYFSALHANKAYVRIRDGLHHTFDLLYSKQKMFTDYLPSDLGVEVIGFKQFFGLTVRGIFQYLLFAAIPLFHYSHRKAYIDDDVKVTYAMICGTAGLQFFAFAMSYNGSFVTTGGLRQEESQRKSILGEMLPESRPRLQFIGLGTLHRIYRLSEGRRRSMVERMEEAEGFDDMVFQYNLLGLFARNQKHPIMMRIVGAIGCKNILQQRWCMKSRYSSRRITALVLEYARCGWKEGHMHDVPSYKKFNENRGQFTLRHQGCYDKLGWTLQGSFDESVLLWHLATDFCYHYTGPSRHGSWCTKGHAYGYQCPAWCEASVHHDTAVLCTHMSNYMAYLLFVKPDMLMAGTRRAIFTEAYKELGDILGKPKKPMLKERELSQRIITKLDGRGAEDPELGSPEGFVLDAWNIAKELMDLPDEDKMWKVIQGMWVEMLCFSATRCRGYLHAKSLGTGVEYLSYVWLLMYYMGMETLADRLQRVDDHDGGEPTRSDYSCREHQAAHPQNSTDTGEGITVAG